MGEEKMGEGRRREMVDGRIERGEVAALLGCTVLLPSSISHLNSPIPHLFPSLLPQLSDTIDQLVTQRILIINML